MQNTTLKQSGLIRSENGFSFRDLNKNGKLDVYEDPRQPIEARVDDLLQQMTLEEKAGMLFINGSVVNDDGSLEEQSNTSALVGAALPQMTNQHMNHFNLWEIPSGRVVARWYNNLQRFAEDTRLGIPVTIASDPRHHFSHNIFSMAATDFSQWCETLGFAAIDDTKLVRQFAEIMLAPVDVTPPQFRKHLLVVFLFACNVSQEVLSLLMGVSKPSIHYWIAGVCTEEFEWQMLREITCWSGQVCFDEKWGKIKGKWYFILCAVDSVSGFPLLLALYPTLDTVSWTLFLKRFRTLYGRPTLIQSDGRHALAAARELVFYGVCWQLCKFHKLRNLMKRLRKYVTDKPTLRRCIRLAKHIFSNTTVSSRKYAATTLKKIAGQEVAEYLSGHILSPWRHLTRSLTNNAAERFNRKITTCFSGRYGIASPQSAAILLRGLWLKEILLNGQKHLDATSTFRQIDLAATCQEYVDTSQILHFFHEHNPELLEKLA